MSRAKNGSRSGEEPFYAAILRKKRKSPAPLSPAAKEEREPKQDKTRPGRQGRAGEWGRGALRAEALPAQEGFASVFPPLPKEAAALVEGLEALLLKAFPLSRQQLSALPESVAELSHLLTDARGERPAAYLNNPAYLSAYAYYFLWWNVARLARLFAGLNPARQLPEAFSAVDFGSGPLTAVCALWIACPHLRKKRIRWYCIDSSREALAAGERLYASLVAATGGEAWKIIRVKGGLDTQIKEKAALVLSANVFNEIMRLGGSSMCKERGASAKKPFTAQKALEALSAFAAPRCELVIAEPGNPDGGAFVTAVRQAALEAGFAVLSPCPHARACPFPGSRRKKWCHFAFDATAAPKALARLSEAAGLPKERAALSFLYLERNAEKALSDNIKEDNRAIRARVLSENIRLPQGKSGRYCCSPLGMLLVAEGKRRNGESLDSLGSGDLLLLRLEGEASPSSARDAVTGALIVNLEQKREKPRSQPLGDQRRNALQAESAPRSSRAGRARKTQAPRRSRGAKRQS